MTEDAAVQEAVLRERLLLSPQVRRSTAEVDALLDPDFREVGASGRLWSRDEILEALAEEAKDPQPQRIYALQMTGRVLARGLVLLSYVSETQGRRARRTSIWKRHADGWRLLHHQGTPLP